MAVYGTVVYDKRIPSRPEKLVSLIKGQADLLWRIMVDTWAYDPSSRPDSVVVRDRLQKVKHAAGEEQAIKWAYDASGWPALQPKWLLSDIRPNKQEVDELVAAIGEFRKTQRQSGGDIPLVCPLLNCTQEVLLRNPRELKDHLYFHFDIYKTVAVQHRDAWGWRTL
ncbi:hypothetical protein FS749_016036 [Ceratobasidium sp. UAMH 11750]|nr:hypothetical protein FS749_016036 [Ceratobasidium sp. UAMH 11750]